MKRISIISVLFVFILMSFVQAQTKRVESIKSESYIGYQLTHPMHEVVAQSKEAYCLLEIDPQKREIKKVYVQIPVASFNSGNSNRDSHAMEVIDAISYPNVKYIATNVNQDKDSIKVTGKLTFHGVTKEVYIAAIVKWSDKKIWVNGAFDVSLTAFNVERPSLLMVPVKDNLKFTFNQVFNY